MFSGNQTDFNTLSKQFEIMASQLQQPNLISQKPPQQQIQTHQPTQSLQLQKLSKQSKQATSSETKKSQSTKKPLTAETLEIATEPQSTIPMLPYTPQGIAELVKQGKINPAQAQMMLKELATEEMSIENWLAQIKQNIEKLPSEAKKAMEELEERMNKVYNELENNLKQQIKVYEIYADQQIELMGKHLNYVKEVFTNLMKEKPNLESDKWTLFGRQLAMALGAISALAHPSYAPYFYMAIPQVVQYWQNEDMYNFEKAMKKFELALKLAGTQLDFYNQIMEHNLKILGKKKEKELLPLTITGQLLMEKYHNFADAYNKMAVEYIKSFSDQIAHELSAIKAGIMYQHYKEQKEIQRLAKEIELARLEELKRHHRVMEGIRSALAKITAEQFNLKKMQQFYPGLFPKEVIKLLNIQDPNVVYQILATYALYGPEKGFAKIQEIISGFSPEASLNKTKKARETEIHLGAGEEDLPLWFYGW
jgi:flagellar motor protein MotB